MKSDDTATTDKPEAVDLCGQADWLDFAGENLPALLDKFPSLDAAKEEALKNGFLLGGGAVPLVRVRLLEGWA